MSIIFSGLLQVLRVVISPLILEEKRACLWSPLWSSVLSCMVTAFSPSFYYIVFNRFRSNPAVFAPHFSSFRRMWKKQSHSGAHQNNHSETVWARCKVVSIHFQVNFFSKWAFFMHHVGGMNFLLIWKDLKTIILQEKGEWKKQPRGSIMGWKGTIPLFSFLRLIL